MAELHTPGSTATLLETRAEWMRHGGVVSWAAVFAGAAAAAAFGLILLTLGTGLGLAAVSPWRAVSETASKFGVAAVVWVCVTQVLTSGLGGYLAGRLRRRWPAVDPDEVYFRDTAHGFLTWALATLLTAASFAALVPAASKAGTQAALQASAMNALLDRGNAEAAANIWPLGYYVDSLFRQPVQVRESSASGGEPATAPSDASASPANTAAPATPSSASGAGNMNASTSANANMPASPGAQPNSSSGAVTVNPVATPLATAATPLKAAPTVREPAAGSATPKDEVMRIFLNSLATDDALSAQDTDYVAYLVARHTGLPQQAAVGRVSATYTQVQQKLASLRVAAKAEADKVRKAGIRAALWLFISLLMGAFAASFMAVFGGRLRDS